MAQENTKSKGYTCPWWLLFTFDNPIRKLVHNPEKILSPYIKTGDTVLDVGCGMGYFTLTLTELVGLDGQVIAADLQVQMLNGLHKRAGRAGLLERIQLHQSAPDKIGIQGPLDFALAFWMVHEVGDQISFLREIYNLLKPGGKLLFVEPIIHVSGETFEQTVALAEASGFQVIEHPKVTTSRAVLLEK